GRHAPVGQRVAGRARLGHLVGAPAHGDGGVVRRLPWRTLREPDPDHRYVVSAGVFEVARARNVPRFLRHAARVRRVLGRTEGLVGFTLLARFRTRTFTEISAFESQEAMRRFVARPEHAAAVGAMVPHIGPRSKFVTIEMYGRD